MMRETILCEEITMLRDEDGTVRIVAESRERGSITLVCGPRASGIDEKLQEAAEAVHLSDTTNHTRKKNNDQGQ